jgi:hypothetical protein
MAMSRRAVAAAGLMAVVVAGSAAVRAQSGAAPAPPAAQHDHQAQDAQPPASQPANGQKMQMHHEMMEQMKAAEARMDALAKTMNDAKGEAKVAAIAAVINELVAEQRAMHSRMMTMHEHMMPMMNEHAGAPMGRGGRRP